MSDRSCGTYLPGRPVVRVCIIHVWNRIQVQGTMAGEQILAMFLRKMGDSVLEIECLLLAGLDSPRATAVVVGMYGLDMLGIAIHLLHGGHKGTRTGDETNCRKEFPGRKQPGSMGEKGQRRVREGDNVAYASIFIHRPPYVGSVLCTKSGVSQSIGLLTGSVLGAGIWKKAQISIVSTSGRRSWRTGSIIPGDGSVRALVDACCNWPCWSVAGYNLCPRRE